MNRTSLLLHLAHTSSIHCVYAIFCTMVAGDGELLVLEPADEWLAWKDSGADREAFLKTWSGLAGVYIP